MSTDNVKEDILQTARRIVRLGPICDSCLGRQFAMLSTGLTNAERGRALKTVLAMQASSVQEGELLEDLATSYRSARLGLCRVGEDAPCWACLGEMSPENLERWAEKAEDAISSLEHNTFLVGTRMSGLLAENEELLLADGGSIHAEPLKSELNREVGKLVAKKTGKQVDFQRPEVTVLLKLEQMEVDLQIASLFLRGRYRKLVRGIPQTRWPCRECRGKGCLRCHGTGRMYPESVDELIRPAVLEASRAEDTVFHGAGREDIDARMLGSGRPFVVEAVRPKVRLLDLAKLEEEINRRAEGKVEVLDLAVSSSEEVEQLKEAPLEKTYSALISFAEDVPEEKLKSGLNSIKGSIDQRTPARVSHRRADKHRERKVLSADLVESSGRSARIIIRGDSGLYIKELISGDGGRTEPSLARILGIDAVVVELDVLDVGGKLHGASSRNAEEDAAQAKQDGQG
jgi:tRNA pseudouridine synthase 10